MGFEDFSDGAALGAASLDNLMSQSIIRCTAATRPSSPSEGWVIYETDTNRFYAYSGTSWVRQPGWGTSAAGARTGVKLRRAATQTIANVSGVEISWDTEDYDSDAFIGVTSTTVTIPTGLAGIYAVTAGVLWADDPTETGGAESQLHMGGRFWRYSTTALNPLATRQFVTAIDVLAEADTITYEAYQNTGGNLNVTTAWLQAYRISV